MLRKHFDVKFLSFGAWNVLSKCQHSIFLYGIQMRSVHLDTWLRRLRYQANLEVLSSIPGPGFNSWGKNRSKINPRAWIGRWWNENYHDSVTERTSYFCLAHKLIWPLWSSHIFTPWGWFILFGPDHFPWQHKNVESLPNYLFLRTFREGRTYFLSAPFIAAEAQHHEESRLIYGPFESTLLDQGSSVEQELDACNPPHTGTPLCHL